MKKFLLSILLTLLCFFGFSYGSNVGSLLVTNPIEDFTIPGQSWTTILDLGAWGEEFTVCIELDNSKTIDLAIVRNYNQSASDIQAFRYWSDWNGNYVCIYKSYIDRYLNGYSPDGEFTFDGDYFILNDLLETDLPICSVNIFSNGSSTDYTLNGSNNNIYLSAGVEYSVTNNNDGGKDINITSSQGSTGGFSQLFINNIEHPGVPLINVYIPDYITWDYSATSGQFDLYVGSGYDQEYIDSVISINSYRPDNEDFTNIFVSGLTLIFPYIFLALLIIFIWKLLKRIFK